MVTRHSSGSELTQAKDALSRKGWSQRQAAPELGITREHLNRVLKGHRQSRRILRGIAALPCKKGGRA